MKKTMKTHSFVNILNSKLGGMPRGSFVDPFTGPNVERMIAPSHIAYAEAEDEGEGDEEPPQTPERTFTQAELDRIIKQRLKKSERELAAAQKRAEKSEASLQSMQAKIDELDDKLTTANKSDEAKELAKLQRKYAQLEDKFTKVTTERDEAVAKATEAAEGLTKHRVSTTLTDALLGAGAYKKGVKRAVEAMRNEGIVQLDEDGNMILTVAGVPYEDATEAAKKWLAQEENEMFAEGMSRGSNSPRPGGGGLLSSKQMDGMRTGSLLQVGLSSPPNK